MTEHVLNAELDQNGHTQKDCSYIIVFFPVLKFNALILTDTLDNFFSLPSELFKE